jgi:hypothetical protein
MRCPHRSLLTLLGLVWQLARAVSACSKTCSKTCLTSPLLGLFWHYWVSFDTQMTWKEPTRTCRCTHRCTFLTVVTVVTVDWPTNSLWTNSLCTHARAHTRMHRDAKMSLFWFPSRRDSRWQRARPHTHSLLRTRSLFLSLSLSLPFSLSLSLSPPFSLSLWMHARAFLSLSFFFTQFGYFLRVYTYIHMYHTPYIFIYLKIYIEYMYISIHLQIRCNLYITYIYIIIDSGCDKYIYYMQVCMYLCMYAGMYVCMYVACGWALR